MKTTELKLSDDVRRELTKLVESDESISEAGRVHSLNPGKFPARGEPEEKARAFDKVNPKTGERPDHSILKSIPAGKYEAVEFSDEGDYIMVLVMDDASSDTKPEYYGVNVMFYPDGKIDASTGDKTSAAQWRKDREKIIKVAKDSLKDEKLPSAYDGLGGKSSKRGKGDLSFDPSAKSDYHGYHDPKTNEGKITFKQFLLSEASVLKLKEPGWYVCDHMDRPIEGPMQERGAKELADEMSEKHAAKRGKGDIPAYEASYFSDYDIRRINEK
jgi:hypothetical protein